MGVNLVISFFIISFITIKGAEELIASLNVVNETIVIPMIKVRRINEIIKTLTF